MIFENDDLGKITALKLCFKLFNADEGFVNDNVKTIKTKDNKFYFSTFVGIDTNVKKESPVKELSFHEYIDIVLENENIEGIAIYFNGDYLFVDSYQLRWLKIKNDEDAYIQNLNELKLRDDDITQKIEKYREETFKMHLQNIKEIWIKKKYEEVYRYFIVLGDLYRNNIGEIFYYIARLSEDVGNLENAERYYKKAIREEEESYWLYYKLGLFYKRNSLYNKAIKVYNSAYNKERFYGFEKKSLDDGFIDIMNELIENADKSKQKIRKRVYVRFLDEIKQIKNLNKKHYNFFDEEGDIG